MDMCVGLADEHLQWIGGAVRNLLDLAGPRSANLVHQGSASRNWVGKDATAFPKPAFISPPVAHTDTIRHMRRILERSMSEVEATAVHWVRLLDLRLKARSAGCNP